MSHCIHIFGASGSGTTTLGAGLADALNIAHLDTDNYYWKRTDPPFVEKNEPSDRIRLIRQDTTNENGWILSGSICSWGDPLLEVFTLAVFLYLDPVLRMERLAERERVRYGDRILPGGDMYAAHCEFMAWAESYDTAAEPVRSLDLHEKWMKNLSCPVIRLDSGYPVQRLIQSVAQNLSLE